MVKRRSKDSAPTRPIPKGWDLYYRVASSIPRGRVATYGQVALWAGRPRCARQVGYALAALRGTRNRIPWQRVLGARPRGMAGVSILDPMGAAVQRDLLEKEGIAFDDRGRVSLERYGWSGPQTQTQPQSELRAGAPDRPRRTASGAPARSPSPRPGAPRRSARSGRTGPSRPG